MDKKIDYHKAGAILLKDRNLLLTHEQGKTFYIAPGGVVEKGEEVVDCLIRELREEINVVVNKEDLEFFGTFYAQAAGAEDKWLQMDVYKVLRWEGEATPTNGEEIIDDIKWVNTQNIPEGIKIGSIFEHEVMPRLKEQDLID